MFAPSIPAGRVRVNAQRATSCSPNRSPSAAARAQELRSHFSVELFDANFRL